MANPDDCLFCKIAAGDVPAEIVREDDHTVAFRDIAPQAPIHVLVVPRVHHENAVASASDPEIGSRLLAAAGEVAASEGLANYRLVFNTGADAGQTVFHTHLHVLGGRHFQWPPG